MNTLNTHPFAAQNLDQAIRQAWHPTAHFYTGLAHSFAETVNRTLPSTIHRTNPDTGRTTTNHYPARNLLTLA